MQSLTFGIPKELVTQSSVDINHLICPICLNLLDNPVACGQDRCFTNFCTVCIEQWLNLPEDTISQESISLNPNQSTNQTQYQQESQFSVEDIFQNINLQENNNITQFRQEQQQYQQQQWVRKCPHCKKVFLKTHIPFISTILGTIFLKCQYYFNGCNQILPYDSFIKHKNCCDFSNVQCDGCNQNFMKIDYQSHYSQCEDVIVKCPKCELIQARKYFHFTHTREFCIEKSMEKKEMKITELQQQLEQQKIKHSLFEQKLNQILRGELDHIKNFTFKTSFIQNYQFEGIIPQQVTLLKSSFNQSKQKNDFLHFYLNRTIKTQTIIGIQWRVKLQKLQGNIFLGICSSLNQNSVDYIINKNGEIKKKENNENKYKHCRKVNFFFSEQDTILYQFLPMGQNLRIQNETKNQQFSFQQSEIIEMGELFYVYFSLECQGDSLLFF